MKSIFVEIRAAEGGKDAKIFEIIQQDGTEGYGINDSRARSRMANQKG